MKIPNWVTDPFLSNDETKMKDKTADIYSGLWAVAKKFLPAFPSSNVVKRGFSVVIDLKTKDMNRLQIVKRGD
ncbi:hypothetical protein T07_12663 [Trichinella nelsoni]|uniref:Uncharacterized protein n=1 Tax=Trichinella nelsoni TaxID=6336 RepID=A0A0V0S028_9BILA|nr:hypothetical protein T07_12663 [Trichinella nelsoni]